MGMLLMLVGGLASLVSFVCWIMVLIKQFQTAGPIHGIIGIVTCGIWTLIWGWMNADKLGIKNIMLIWTGCFVVSILFQLLGSGLSAMS